MKPKSKTASTGVGARASGRVEELGGRLNRNLNRKSSSMARPASSNIVRLPVFVDGVWICNEFVRIGPGLRASLRRLATEGKL